MIHSRPIKVDDFIQENKNGRTEDKTCHTQTMMSNYDEYNRRDLKIKPKSLFIMNR